MAGNSGKLFGTAVVCVVVVSGGDSTGEVSEGGVSTGEVSDGGDSGGGESVGRVSRSGGSSCADAPEVVEVVAEGSAGVSLGALSRGGGVVETWLLVSPHEAAAKATATKPIATAEY